MDTPVRALETLENLPIADLLPSNTPSQVLRRRRFKQEELAEMAETIKQDGGVIEPVIVRPHPEIAGKYEIGAGERRFIATGLAGLADIASIIRPMSDRQLVRLQTVENLHRQGTSPVEEAENYHALMSGETVDGQPYTVALISKEVGKSASYVYSKLKLMDLCEEIRDECLAEDAPETIALAIGRIPGKKLQQKALKEVCPGGKWVSTREALRLIQERYMVRLNLALFDIKVADYQDTKGNVIAGACGTCPKRSGNNRELFPDVDDPNVCTDQECFGAKKLAHVARIKAVAEAKGHIVVTDNEAKAVVQSMREHKGVWIQITDFVPDHPGVTYKKALGKETPQIRSIMHPDFLDKPPLEVVPLAEATEILKTKGVLKAPPKSKAKSEKAAPVPTLTPAGWTDGDKPASTAVVVDRAHEQAARIVAIERETERLMFMKLRSANKGELSPELLLALVRYEWENTDHTELLHLAQAWSELALNNDDEVGEYLANVFDSLPGMDATTLTRVLVDMLICNGFAAQTGVIDDMAKRLGIKIKSLRDEAEKEATAALKPAEEPAPAEPPKPAKQAKPPAKKPTKKPATKAATKPAPKAPPKEAKKAAKKGAKK